MKFELPQIPEAEQTPVVRGLLILVEKLIEHTQKMQEEMISGESPSFDDLIDSIKQEVEEYNALKIEEDRE